MSQLAIKLPAYQNQTELNLRRWEEIIADPSLAALDFHIETNRHGQLVMTPPPQNPHSDLQTEVLLALARLLPSGIARVEVPISTADGIKAADVIWYSRQRREEIYDRRACLGAPEICVEVLSPSNSREEMSDKKSLYFDAGASEVWLCQEDGTMVFFVGPDHPAEPASLLCPEFPKRIEI